MIQQILTALSIQGSSSNAHYFRTSDGHEIDLLLDIDDELWAMEIKLTSSPSPSDMDRLDRAADMAGASRRFLISQTSRPSGDSMRASCHLEDFLERLVKGAV